MSESLQVQIRRLAEFILNEVDGEPSKSEGAVDCAIRVMRTRLAAGKRLGLEAAVRECEEVSRFTGSSAAASCAIRVAALDPEKLAGDAGGEETP